MTHDEIQTLKEGDLVRLVTDYHPYSTGDTAIFVSQASTSLSLIRPLIVKDDSARVVLRNTRLERV